MGHSLWNYFTLAAILIALDRGSKYFFQDSSKAFINKQGTFSFPLPSWLIIIMSIVIITVLFLILFKKNTPIAMTQGLTFLLSGGVGNLIDRLLYGYVQDIIAIFSVRFNLADMYILIGAVFLLSGVYQAKPQRKHLKPRSQKT